MFDNAGRLIWTRNNEVNNSRSIDIQVSNLRPGLYYIKTLFKIWQTRCCQTYLIITIF
jgi:hypothetical protein